MRSSTWRERLGACSLPCLGHRWELCGVVQLTSANSSCRGLQLPCASCPPLVSSCSTQKTNPNLSKTTEARTQNEIWKQRLRFQLLCTKCCSHLNVACRTAEECLGAFSGTCFLQQVLQNETTGAQVLSTPGFLGGRSVQRAVLLQQQCSLCSNQLHCANFCLVVLTCASGPPGKAILKLSPLSAHQLVLFRPKKPEC